MTKKVKKGRGFTLLELLIVVVVLAVLAGLALPQYLRTVARAKESEGWQNLATLRSAELRYYAEWTEFMDSGSFSVLDISDPNTVTSRMFDYDVVPGSGDGTFDATATPVNPPCTGCRTLTITNDGARSEF